MTFLTYGCGMFVGSWLSGAVVEHYSSTGNGQLFYQWRSIWFFPAAASAIVLVLFLLTFNDTKEPKPLPHDAADALMPQTIL